MDAKIIEMPEQKEEYQVPSYNESKEIIKSIIKDLNLSELDLDDNLAIDDMVYLFTIMDLPDEEFTLMSGVMLSTLERGLNNVNDRMILIQTLQIAGIKVEDVIQSYEAIVSLLEEQFKDVYDEKRIDYIKAVLTKIINAISETEGVPKRIVHIPVELCNENAQTPKYANVGDAGLDLYAIEDYEIKPGETKLIPTGIKVAIPNGYELQVRPKSGRSLKTKLRVANTPGTIDPRYFQEVGVIIENIESPIKDITTKEVFDDNGKIDHLEITSIEYGKSYFINKGEKFAQLVLSEVPTAIFDIVKDINIFGNDRGGGFGSTDLK